MSSNDEQEAPIELQIDDAAGRRRFLRTGSVVVTAAVGAGTLAGAALVAAGPASASDCDRGGGATAAQKAQAGQGSDSDQGAGADPIGCGRTQHEAPKISALPNAPADGTTPAPAVTRVRT